MDVSSSQHRFRGAILGTAVGDALGAPFEGAPRVDAAAVDRWAGATGPLRWTDDTAMTIVVAESLAESGTFDGADMAARFASAHEAEPWRGYAGGPPQVFAALRSGAAWDEPAQDLFGGRGSYGNGGAMRVAPAGLFAAPDLDVVVALARDTARITHAHELALQGAALQACAVACLLDVGLRGAPWSAAELVEVLRPAAPADEYQQRLDAVAELAGGRASGPPPPGEVVAAIGHGVAAHEAVPAALLALAVNPSSFQAAVGYAVGLGGDADTVAAMVGALAGALHGDDAIPEGWLRRLERRSALVAVADSLWEAASRGRPGP